MKMFQMRPMSALSGSWLKEPLKIKFSHFCFPMGSPP
jgi:hypothetical protein